MSETAIAVTAIVIGVATIVVSGISLYLGWRWR